MENVEVYVLSARREKAVGLSFLNAFLPRRRPLADEFPFPEFEDTPQDVYPNPEDVMQRLELEPSQSYSLYWDSDDRSRMTQGMLLFTKDGAMIAGLVVPAGEAGHFLLEIAEIVGGKFGFVTLENHPPETTAEFHDLCRISIYSALVDGHLRNGGDIP